MRQIERVAGVNKHDASERLLSSAGLAASERATVSPTGGREPGAVGEPVLLIPGFVCGDGSLGALAALLSASGHVPHLSGLTCNVDCAEASVNRLADRLLRLVERHGSRMALVGHSRGGLFARVLAYRRPDLVSGVVTLGSPHQAPLRVHPVLWGHAMALAVLGTLGVPGLLTPTCAVSGCCARFWRDLAAPLPAAVGLLSIYSTTDGIVDWRACLDADGRHAEVRAGHYRMPGHPVALRTIASALKTFHATPWSASETVPRTATGPPLLRDARLNSPQPAGSRRRCRRSPGGGPAPRGRGSAAPGGSKAG
jgi:triacylglycerol lipase